jgi:diazepam-binding inhibitor (GABA receptor modulating acyl-CoA-binding protein)
MSVDAQFNKAVAAITKPSPSDPQVKLDTKKKLMFYALFKQATEGKCTAKPPSKTDMAAFYKHKAWTQCGDMSKEEAKKKYVELALQAAPHLKSKL